MRGRHVLRVYFDTSAWNVVCDWAVGKSHKWIEGPEYLFSSCNLDEFSIASTSRARELAAYAWRISSRRKLLDHLELSVAEIAAFQNGVGVATYDDARDRTFTPAWRAMRTSGLTNEMRDALAADIDAAKSEYRDWFRFGRETFHPFFSSASKLGVARSWPDLLAELQSGPEMRAGLRQSLTDAGLLRRIPRPNELEDVPWTAIPCTSCWLEYHTAMYYLAAFDSKRLGRPDKGDQVDFRHACYAGMADIFVTGDRRMHAILEDMIPSRRARLLTAQEYLDEAARQPLTKVSSGRREVN